MRAKYFAFATLFFLISTQAYAWLYLAALPRFAAAFTATNSQKLAMHAVGATLTYLLIDGATSQYLKLTNNDEDLPAGWSDSNSPPSTAPATLQNTSGYAYVGGNRLEGISYTSAEQARDEWIEWRNSYNLDFYEAVGGCNWVSSMEAHCPVRWSSLSCAPNFTNFYNKTLYIISETAVTQSCPVGYSFDGSSNTCILASSSEVRYPANGKCELIKDASGNFVPNTRDVDCDGISAPTTNSNSLVTTDEQGRVTSETRVEATSTGQTITQTEYDYPSATTTTTTATIDQAGTITGIVTTTSDGVDTAPETSTVTNIPNDYARQSTLESIDSKLLPPPALNTQVDDLYQPGALTYDSVITGFTSRAQNSQVYLSITDFFSTDVAGQCPLWEIPSVMNMPAIPLTAQCSQMMENIWPLISAIILATAGFIAFRWAFL